VKGIGGIAHEIKVDKIDTIKFDWLDCPDLAQPDSVEIASDDLSIPSFGTDCPCTGTTTINDNSLATAQVSVAGTVDKEIPPAS